MERDCAVGLQLPEVERRVAWPELLDIARTAEEVGLDSLWVGDHLTYRLPDGSDRGPWEAWTSLAALAVATDRVRLGPLVASLGFHDPAMVAKMAATVDAISGGRLVLGVGAGWNRREYDAFGLPFDHRVSRFAEAFGLVRRLLAGETVTHAGRYHRLDACRVDPPPSRPGGPPLMVGSTGTRMLAVTLPHVSAWNVWFADHGNTAVGFAAIRARVRLAAAEAGREPDDVRATAAVYVRAPGGTGRDMAAGDEPGVAPITGEPDAVARSLRAFAAAGARELQVVLDPITVAAVRWLGEVLRCYDAAAPAASATDITYSP